jgi:hypothetical protein
MRSLASSLILSLLLLFTAACGGSDVGPGMRTGSGDEDTATTDKDTTGEADGLSLPDTSADLPKPDAAGPDGGPDGGLDAEADAGTDAGPSCTAPFAEWRCPCEQDDDCLSGYCVATHEGQVCSTPCQDQCPEPGWICSEVPSTCPDCQYICVFQYTALCQPCMTDDECAGTAASSIDARCVDYGDAGSFCGAPCDLEGDCPEGYLCQPADASDPESPTQCVRMDGECDCSPRAMDLEAMTTCAIANGHGDCVGERACGPEGLSDCDGPEPAPEACNGLDDDCDGDTDEEVPPEPCALENEWGACPAEARCELGAWICEGTAPAEEACNGLDDDCDGDTDEGFVDIDGDGGANCVDADDDDDGVLDDGDGSGEAGDAPCADGSMTDCDDNCPLDANPDQADLDKDGKGDACDCDVDGDGFAGGGCGGEDCDDLDPLVNPGSDELSDAGGDCDHCDGRDNDCDGDTDEGCADTDGDAMVDCLDPDDDGDGVPDDGDDSGEAGDAPCGSDQAEGCDDNCPSVPNEDQVDLDEDGQGDACDPDRDGDEVPNEADNCPDRSNPEQADLDGDDLGDACEDDTDGDGDLDDMDCAPLDALIHHAAPERCNGLDDDCDALIDAEDGGDLLAHDPTACESQIGACAGCSKPVELCVDGAWLPCAPEHYAACSEAYVDGVEPRCDGLDNNCDGDTDEGFSILDWDDDLRLLGQLCGTGACASGTVVCRADGTGAVCSSLAQASQEVCNFIDDDCDGVTDDSFSFTDWDGQARAVGEACGAGACAGGLVICAADHQAAVCNSAEESSLERCNGGDDDCDGQIDEGFVITTWNGQTRTLGQACGAGACADGLVVCAADGEEALCSTWSLIGLEVCNGSDDDCDGLLDAGDPDLLSHDGPACEKQVGVCAGAMKPAHRCSGGAWLACFDTDYEAHDADYQHGVEVACDSLDNDCDGASDEDFTDDVDHCGGCGVACTNEHGGTQCQGGVCAPSCASGYRSCDEDPTNGCEQAIDTLAHCGACDAPCDLPHAVESCATGSCAIAACEVGWCNLDGGVNSGCDHDLDPDPICDTATSLGTVAGDLGAETSEHFARGEKWLRVNVTEQDFSLTDFVYLSAQIALDVPDGADYDLLVYCDDCDLVSVSSTTEGSLPEVVTVAWEETCMLLGGVLCLGVPDLTDSSREILIQIKHKSANTCDDWHLTVTGNTVAETTTCGEK